MEEHGGHCKSLEVCRRQHYCVSRCASRSLFNSSIQPNCRRARRHNSCSRRPKPRYFASNVPRRAGTLEWHSVLLLRADDKTGYQMKSGQEKQTGLTGNWRGVWPALPGMPTAGSRPPAHGNPRYRKQKCWLSLRFRVVPHGPLLGNYDLWLKEWKKGATLADDREDEADAIAAWASAKVSSIARAFSAAAIALGTPQSVLRCSKTLQYSPLARLLGGPLYLDRTLAPALTPADLLAQCSLLRLDNAATERV